MRIGEKAVFKIPPILAYGSKSKNGFPPNKFIFFLVELLDFEMSS